MGKSLIIKGADFSANAVAEIVLPYTPLSYASVAANTQYVSSPYKEDANTKIEIRCEVFTPSTAMWFFGRKKDTDGALGIQLRTTGTPSVFIGSNSTGAFPDSPSADNKYTIVISHTDILINGQSVKGEKDVSFVGKSPKTFSLMNSETGGSIEYQNENISRIKFFGFKQWDGDNLVLDAIPVEYNGVKCLYNKVDETYIYADDGNSLIGN